MQSSNSSQSVKGIIFTLGFAFVTAAALVASLIYYYGPNGTYLVEQVLLTPQVIQTVNQLPSQKTKVSRISQALTIELSYYDANLRFMQKKFVTLLDYERFYQLISNEKSIELSDEQKGLFTGLHPTTLTLSMNAPDGSLKTINDVIQIVQAKHNYFRVLLNEQNKQGEWVYFYYPSIESKILNLLIDTHE